MAKQLKPRRIFPLPVEGWTDDPRYLRMPSAGQGIMFNLFLHFWRVECVDFTATDSEMRAIARAHTPTWARYRADVLSLFEDYKPAFAAAYAERLRKRRWLEHLSERGRSERKAKRLATQAELRSQANATALFPRKLAASPAVPPDMPSKAGGFRER
jgi:hypothetical protein